MAVKIYTDGSCLYNPGPGGWAAILRWRDHEKTLTGGEDNTTNNRMELMAAIMALEALNRPAEVTLTSDSTYLKDGITKWIEKWKKNGWKTADKKPVANQDLWIRLAEAIKPHSITWAWVKGHAGHSLNERCDDLARMEAENIKFKSS